MQKPKQMFILSQFHPHTAHTYSYYFTHTLRLFFLLPLDLEHNFDQGTFDQDDFI